MKMYEFRLTFNWNFVPKGQVNTTPALVQLMAMAQTRRQAIIWSNDA